MGGVVAKRAPNRRTSAYSLEGDPYPTASGNSRTQLNVKDVIRRRVEAVAERNAATRSSSAPKLSAEEFNKLKNKEKALEEIRMYAPVLVQATTTTLTVRWDMIYAAGQAKIQHLDLQWMRVDEAASSESITANASLPSSAATQLSVPCLVLKWSPIPNEVIDEERREVYLAGLAPSNSQSRQMFVFRVRARNSSGWSSWSGLSQPMSTQSSSLVDPLVEPVRPYVFKINWAKSIREDFYGQVIYCKLYVRRVSEVESGTDKARSVFFTSENFKEVYSGRDTEYIHGDKPSHKSLEAGKTYAFKLEIKTGLNARDKRYSSVYSSEPMSLALPNTVPFRPNPVWAEELNSDGDVRLTWSSLSNGGSPIVSYKLYSTLVGAEEDEGNLLYQGPDNDCTLQATSEDFPFENGCTYKLFVIATNELGESSPSKLTRFKKDTPDPKNEASAESANDEPAAQGEWRTDNGSLLNILAPSPDSIVNLPAGWQEYWDPKNEECFYYNSYTGETQWDIPVEEESQQASPVQSPEEQAFLIFRKKRFRLLQTLREGQQKTEYLQVSKLHIRRDNLFDDSVVQLLRLLPEQLSWKLRIIYTGEDGIDSGGLSKDWYLECSRAFLMESHGLFERGSAETLNVSTRAHVLPGNVGDYFHAFGRLLGKAIYEQQLVDAPLCTGLMKRVLQIEPTLDDLRELDSILGNSMEWILHNDIEGVIEETFSITVDEFGAMNTYELVPDGKSKEVTEENKKEYVSKVVQWKFGGFSEKLVERFKEGLYQVVPFDLLRDFRPEEVLLLLNGKEEVNVADIKNGCVRYEGGFTQDSLTVSLFWQAMEEFTNEQRQQVVRFSTGCDKVPLDGFSPFMPFTLTKSAELTPDALPVAHTCFNQLVLPAYETIEQLSSKLLYACAHATGFNMT